MAFSPYLVFIPLLDLISRFVSAHSDGCWNTLHRLDLAINTTLCSRTTLLMILLLLANLFWMSYNSAMITHHVLTCVLVACFVLLALFHVVFILISKDQHHNQIFLCMLNNCAPRDNIPVLLFSICNLPCKHLTVT